jgi:c(7)-type cytochrome triheme protein
VRTFLSQYWFFTTLIVAVAAALLLVGCNAHSPIIDDLFIPLPPSGEVINSPRHPPPPKQEKIVIVQEEVIKPPDVDWAGIYQGLPRDSKGAVDWMRALDEKTLTLKPGVDPAAEPASTKDSEIVFVPEGNPGKTATFRHATHTQWLTCKNCHNTVFKKRDDNLQFTHDEMETGKYCGACHFKVVVVQSGCKGCHSGKKPATGATPAPAEAPAAAAPAKAPAKAPAAVPGKASTKTPAVVPGKTSTGTPPAIPAKEPAKAPAKTPPTKTAGAS